MKWRALYLRSDSGSKVALQSLKVLSADLHVGESTFY